MVESQLESVISGTVFWAMRNQQVYEALPQDWQLGASRAASPPSCPWTVPQGFEAVNVARTCLVHAMELSLEIVQAHCQLNRSRYDGTLGP